MAWTFSNINTVPATEGNFVWLVKTALVSAGWSVARSGDGTTFSNSGDVHTAYAQLDVTNAWLELRQPVSVTPRRSLLLQKTSTAGAWRCWYSSDGTGFKWSYSAVGTTPGISLVSGTTFRITAAAATFIAGDVGQTIRVTGATTAANNGDFPITAQTATTIDYTNAAGVAEAYTGTCYVDTPSRTGTGLTATLRGIASDEAGQINTPASTTTWLPNPTTYTNRMAVIAGGSSESYSFFAFTWAKSVDLSTGGIQTAIGLDVCAQVHASDPDPAVVVSVMQGDTDAFQEANPIFTTTPATTSSRIFGWFQKSLAGQAYVAYPPCLVGGTEGFGTFEMDVDRWGQSPTDNTFPEIPVWYWRGGATYTTQRGRKGQSQLFRGVRSSFGSFRLNTTRTRIGFGYLSLPWDGSTLPLF